jgi:hypothetical protein
VSSEIYYLLGSFLTPSTFLSFQDHADLASVSTLEEHRFIVKHLNKIDPQHRRWYISTRQEDQNRWVNMGDGTQMLNLQEYFLKVS